MSKNTEKSLNESVCPNFWLVLYVLEQRLSFPQVCTGSARCLSERQLLISHVSVHRKCWCALFNSAPQQAHKSMVCISRVSSYCLPHNKCPFPQHITLSLLYFYLLFHPSSSSTVEILASWWITMAGKAVWGWKRKGGVLFDTLNVDGLLPCSLIQLDVLEDLLGGGKGHLLLVVLC